MLVVLSATTFDATGYVELECSEDSKLGDTVRRVNRVATLDGGSVFNDFGYTEADRTIDLTWPAVSSSADAAVERLVQLYAWLHVSTRAGVFLAAPQSFTPGAAQSRLRLLVSAKLSA